MGSGRGELRRAQRRTRWVQLPTRDRSHRRTGSLTVTDRPTDPPRTGAHRLVFEGELTVASGTLLAEFVDDLERERPLDHVVLDLAGLRSIDVAGIDLLAAARGRLRERGVRVDLVEPPPAALGDSPTG